MRIIAGSFGSRQLKIPPASLTRPTSDRTRESIFNILQSRIDFKGIQVLDAFAGSGAMGLEALSRGASHITFIEKHPHVYKILRQNVQNLKVDGQTTLIMGDATHPQKAKAPIDLAFLDPPYQKNLESQTLLALRKQGWFKTGTIIVLEMAKNDLFQPLEGFECVDQRAYGVAQVIFLYSNY